MLPPSSLTWVRPLAARAVSLVGHRLTEIPWRRFASRLREIIVEYAPAAVGVSGLFLARRELRARLLAAALVGVGLLGVAVVELSTGAAIACFVLALALRYAFLFASFTPSGVAARLKSRFGVERGHALYATALDLLLLAQRLTSLALVAATAHAAAGTFGAGLVALGVLLVPAGVGVSVCAVRAAGLEALHYRDLFVGSRSTQLAKAGPYARWANPMYSVGPLAGYGLALIALSPVALLAAGVSQALLLAFNELVERPALRSADNIFVETQSRYELARTLLGFDPRSELERRIHSAPSSNAISANEFTGL